MHDVTFSQRELDVMSIPWREGSGTVAEVREALGGEAAYTTILKILQILEEKAHVRHKKESRAYRYLPAVEAERAGDLALDRV